MASSKQPSDYKTFTIGWITALRGELTAALAMLDEECQQPHNFVQNPRDPNSYSWGRIGVHYVVIASIGEGSYGMAAAAGTATSMVHSLPHIRFGLMVGIGAGIPRLDTKFKKDRSDIRLGDIVVGLPEGKSSGIEQYDLVKLKAGGKVEPVGYLTPPPPVLLTALAKLRAEQRRKGSQLPRILADALEKSPMLAMRDEDEEDAAFTHQGAQNDRLFVSTSTHVDSLKVPSNVPGQTSQEIIETEDCTHCDSEQEFKRPARTNDHPRIHYGVIASGNSVVKDGISRDRILQQIGTKCLCFEMEAAGLMNNFPCLVIRGICDYADSHKNDRWQNYAAIAAAAYAKELLHVIDAVNVERSEQVGDIMRIVSEIEATTRDTHREVQELSAGDRYYKLRSWLSAPDPSIDHNKASNLHHPGTGEWFLRSPKYLQWKMECHSALWLYGGPGCGKTILSSTIINDLQDRGLVCLYFYFTFTDAKKQSLDMAIRSLIDQLYRQSETAKNYLNTVFDPIAGNLTQPGTKSLCDWFDTMVAKAGGVWVVLDALDEWDNIGECQQGQGIKNKGLLQWVKTLIEPSENKFHVIFTSREDKSICETLKTNIPKDMQISIRNEHVNADIQSFIQEAITTWDGLSKWEENKASQEKIEKSLVGKANGMFRWVFCQLVSLQYCDNDEELQATLDSLPETLDETYERILSKIPTGIRKQRAWRILQFLLYSPDPLTLEEAVDMIAVPIIKEEQPRPKLKSQSWPDKPDILSYCPSLVSITPTTRLNGEGMGIVQLAHFSVKEYLLCSRLQPEVSQAFDERMAKTSMAKTCLIYLLDMNHDLPLMNLSSSYPLAPYAAQYWTRYAAQADCNSISELVKEFLHHKDCYRTCRQLFKFDGEYEERDISAFRTMVREYGPTLSSKHIYEWIRRFSYLDFDNEERYRQESGHQSQASNPDSAPHLLYFCASEGLLSAVETLINERADTNKNGGRYGNALQAASYRGHEYIVRLLVERGRADVNQQGGSHGNALQAALFCGHEFIVQFLIRKGARDVNEQAGYYNNALQTASFYGHEPIVKWLIEENIAEVNGQGGTHGNALQAASTSGRESMVRFLIGKGAYVNADAHQGGLYITALWAAVSCGHVRVAEILLKAATVVDWPEERDGILAHAVRSGRGLLVKTLLDNGVKVSEQALQKASQEGLYDITSTLVKWIPDGDKIPYCNNALLEASKRRRFDIAEMLLENGAKADARDAGGNSALSRAADSGDERICKLLLSKGASFEVDSSGHHLFSKVWNVEIIRLMPLDDFEISFVQEKVLSALQKGEIGVAKELLDHFGHSQFDISHEVLREALNRAACQMEPRKVRTLLEIGADPNTMDDNGVSIIHKMLSSGDGHLEGKATYMRARIIDILLRYDADGGEQEIPATRYMKYYSRDILRYLQDWGPPWQALRRAYRGSNPIPYQVALETGEDGKTRLRVSRKI